MTNTPTWTSSVMLSGVKVCSFSASAPYAAAVHLPGAVALVPALGFVGCEKGPMEKAGEKVDKAVDKVTK